MPREPTAARIASAVASGEPGGPADVTIVAQNIAFEGGTTEAHNAPAGKPFTIKFTNDDAGIPHNVSIRQGGPTGTELFKGDIFPGVETRIYNTLPHHVPALLRKHPPRCAVGFIAGTRSAEMRQGGFASSHKLAGDRWRWIEGTHLYPMERPDDTAMLVLELLASDLTSWALCLSSTIVTVAVMSSLVEKLLPPAIVDFLEAICGRIVSSGSCKLSFMTANVMVFETSPGLKVTVPGARLWSTPAVAVPPTS